ncbi:hypothetical protein TeGR_g6843 [Tetraparma gracilis]|uniref:FAD/NAD(P)-binding domain-containing protein n=1 Tax=Tetraparma gracilis TaxID=2962635 RepID=A0ABQ6M697_9STRA|nr:hypothetical protein TeGR_g6843 [Tetraparma gracilis]
MHRIALSCTPRRRASGLLSRLKSTAVLEPIPTPEEIRSPLDAWAPCPSGKERVVVLGTGWGGFNLVQEMTSKPGMIGTALGRPAPNPNVAVTVISPANHFVFTPLLPSTAVGTLEFRSIQEPVRSLEGINYLQAKGRSIDYDRQVVRCVGTHTMSGMRTFEVPYDKLVIGVGVKTGTFGTTNVAEFEGKSVFFLKHLHHARGIRLRTLELFEIASYPSTCDKERRRLLSFVIVGAGPTSCEYASELHDFVQEDLSRVYPDLIKFMSITVIEAGEDILTPFDQSLRDYVKDLFANRSIEVRLRTAVKGIYAFKHLEYKQEGTKAILSDGTELEYGLMVWSAGLAPTVFTEGLDSPDLWEKDRIARTAAGRIVTDEFLRVKGREGKVWAIGDCAEVEGKPLPQLAQVAQQQARYLARVMGGRQGEEEKPWSYFTLGAMMSAGAFKGIYDGSLFGDPHGWNTSVARLSGVSAWAAWRGAYWARQVSLKNKVLIPMYWIKAQLLGRDVSKF